MGKLPKILNINDLNNTELNEQFFDDLAGAETPKTLLEHLNRSQSQYKTFYEEFALDYDRRQVVYYQNLTTSEAWKSDDYGKQLFPTL